MRLLGIRRQDLERLDEIYRTYHEDEFSVPSLEDTITSATVEHEGKLIGFGLVKILAEATMVLDLGESKKNRLQGMQLLMDEAIGACRKHKISQLHVFVKDDKLIKLLQQKYAFKIASGTAMVLEV